MADLKTQIVVGADSSGVAAGLEPGKAALKGFAQSALVAGKEAGGSLEGVGDKAFKGGQKVDTATKSMIGSIQRLTAATEAGDKTSRQYYESIAKLRGVDASTLKPYLDQLDASKTKALEAAKANESFASSFSSLKTVALAAGAALGAFSLYIQKINTGVDALNDLKDATGASIENISALEDVARRTGGSFDTVSTALIKFNQGLNSAKEGSDAERAITALGLSVKELKDLDPAEAFRRTAIALSGFADDGNKARLTQELFGKSLKEVAPLLKDLAEKGQLVSTVTAQQADEAEKFNKELFNMQKNSLDTSRALVGPLITSINEVIKKFREGRAAGESFFEIATRRYVENVRELYGAAPRTGGASGSFGDPIPPPPKPSLPDISNPPKPVRSGGGGAEKVDPQIKAYQMLVVSIREKIAANQEEINLGRKLTDSEKQVLEVQKLLAKGSISAKDAASAKTKALLAEFAATENMRIANEANLALEKTLREEKYKSVEAIEKANASGLEQNKNLTDEIAMIGLNADAQQALTQARLQDVIGIKEQALALVQNEQIYSKQQNALEEEIRLLKEKAALQGQKFDRSAEAEKLSELEKQGAKFATDLESGITSSLSKAFSSGKGFFKSLWEDIKNLFKTTTLKLLVNTVIGGAGMGGTLANAASSAFGGGGSSAGGSIGGMLSSGKSIYDAISSGFASVGASTSAYLSNFAVSSAGQAMGLSTTVQAMGPAMQGALAPTINVMTSTASSMAAAAGSMASAGAGIAAGLALRSVIGGGYSVSKGYDTFQKVGVGVATLVGGPVLGAIAGAAAGAINRIFGMGAKTAGDMGLRGSLNVDGASSVENYAKWTQKGGLFRSDKSGTETSAASSELQTYLNSSVAVMASTTRAYADSLGLTAEKITGYTKNINLSLTGLDEKGVQAAIDKVLAEFGDSLAGAVLGESVKLAKAGETTGATLARLGSSLVAVNSTFAMLGKSLMSADLAGAAVSSQLVDVFGGVEKFAAATDAYYQGFYTDEEKRLQTIKTINAATAGSGLDAATATRESFRALVNGQEVTTEAGQKTYASLLSVAGALAGLLPPLDDVKNKISDILQGLVKERGGLEASLLDAQGNGTGASALRREQAIAGFVEAEIAAYDYNRALEVQITALNDASATIKAAAEAEKARAEFVASQRSGLQDQLNGLTDTAAQALTRQRDALDESNRGLFDQIEAIKATKIAAEESAAALLKAAEAQQMAATAALNAANAGANDALTGLQRAVSAQKAQDAAMANAAKEAAAAIYKAQNSALQTSSDKAKLSLDGVANSLGNLRNLSQSLRNSLNSNRIIGSEGAFRNDAQLQINAALNKAKSGGGLPLKGELESALSTINKPSEALFGSFVDYARDFYKTANDIAALADLTDAQVTADEITQGVLKEQLETLDKQRDLLKDGFQDQVSGLDDILSTAQLQLDAANGINSSVLSVADALDLFNQTISALIGERQKQNLPTTAGGIKAMSSAAGSFQNSGGDGILGQFVTGLYTSIANKSIDQIDQQGYAYWLQEAKTKGEAATQQAFEASVRSIRGFASGGMFGGGLRIVGEDGPELEATGPARIFSAEQTRSMLKSGGANNAELAVELRAMAARLEAIEANTRASAGHTAATDRKLARVIPGNALITQAAI